MCVRQLGSPPQGLAASDTSAVRELSRLHLRSGLGMSDTSLQLTSDNGLCQRRSVELQQYDSLALPLLASCITVFRAPFF